MVDMSKFHGKVVVHTPSKKEYIEFMKECEKLGYKIGGESPTAPDKIALWDVYGTATCVNGESAPYLSYCEKDWFAPRGYEVIEYSDPCKPDLPRICYILGGEKTPLKIGERFGITEVGTGFHINEDGVMKFGGDNVAMWQLCEAVNHPEKIIRRPQFTDDEKAFMRLLVKNGLPWIARSKDNDLAVYHYEPDSDEGYFASTDDIIPNDLFPQIAFENSPIDCRKFMGSEDK